MPNLQAKLLREREIASHTCSPTRSASGMLRNGGRCQGRTLATLAPACALLGKSCRCDGNKWTLFFQNSVVARLE